MKHHTIHWHRLKPHAEQSYSSRIVSTGHEEDCSAIFGAYLMGALGVLLFLALMSGCSVDAKENHLTIDNTIPKETSKMSKFDETLKVQIEKARTASPDTEIPVILHFKQGADPKKLEHRGFKFERVISQESGLASGTITPNSLKGLEDEETIEFLEPDHQADILPSKSMGDMSE